MRHLFVTNDFPPKQGGIESYLTTLCAGFDPDDVVVVAPARRGHEVVDRMLGYTIVRLPGTYLRPTKEVQNRLVEVARAEDVDAVHFLQAFPLGRMAPHVGRITSLPVTVVAHGSGDVFLPARAPFVKRAVRRTLTSVDLVFAVSRYTLAAVETFTDGRARMGLLPPAVDVDRFSLAVSGSLIRQRYRLHGRFVVLFVSRLRKRKGADVFLRALSRLPWCTGIVVGSGPEEASLKRLADELEIGSRATFAGQVDDAQLPEFYAAADVFCMPCRPLLRGLDTEGFGIVYLEAAASGLPSVAGRCGGSVEAVVDRKTGLLLSESTTDAVVEAIRWLRREESERLMMGAAARERAEREFAPKVLARRLEEQLAKAR